MCCSDCPRPPVLTVDHCPLLHDDVMLLLQAAARCAREPSDPRNQNASTSCLDRCASSCYRALRAHCYRHYANGLSYIATGSLNMPSWRSSCFAAKHEGLLRELRYRAVLDTTKKTRHADIYLRCGQREQKGFCHLCQAFSRSASTGWPSYWGRNMHQSLMVCRQAAVHMASLQITRVPMWRVTMQCGSDRTGVCAVHHIPEPELALKVWLAYERCDKLVELLSSS